MSMRTKATCSGWHIRKLEGVLDWVTFIACYTRPSRSAKMSNISLFRVLLININSNETPTM